MADADSSRPEASLSQILDVLRDHGHVVRSIKLHPSGEIEIALDTNAAAQTQNDLDQWRARKRVRRQTKESD